MKKKKNQVSEERRLLSNKRALMISASLVVVIISGFVFYRIFLQTPEIKFSSKAAIIDQLGKDFPNSEFNETATNLLENAGFSVYYHEAESVNVDFFKNLAKYDYGLIILRAHSALRKDETAVDIFTSEVFNDNVYIEEQNRRLLASGYYIQEPNKFYFVITSKFIENLEGYFPKSIVIAMGCNSLNSSCTGMANAFISKGARAYIGWTGYVDSSHTDSQTEKLLRTLLENNKTIADSVANTEPDWHYPNSEMEFYPSSAGNLRVSDLMAETKNRSATSQIIVDNSEQIFQIYTSNVTIFKSRGFQIGFSPNRFIKFL